MGPEHPAVAQSLYNLAELSHGQGQYAKAEPLYGRALPVSWCSGNKRALSAGLLNWRDRCRAQGQAFLAEMRALSKDRPQQLMFRF